MKVWPVSNGLHEHGLKIKAQSPVQHVCKNIVSARHVRWARLCSNFQPVGPYSLARSHGPCSCQSGTNKGTVIVKHTVELKAAIREPSAAVSAFPATSD